MCNGSLYRKSKHLSKTSSGDNVHTTNMALLCTLYYMKSTIKEARGWNNFTYRCVGE